PYLLEVDAAVVNGELHIDWKYGTAVHQQQTIKHLAERFTSHLTALAEYCATAPPTATPSDFPLTKLDQDEVDDLMSLRDPGSVEDAYPLSPLQLGMLFHTVHEPEGNDHVEQFSLEIVGALDTASFAEAWEHVIRRHPVLRSTFVWEKLRQPVQVVHRGIEPTFRYRDWSGVSARALEIQFADWLAAERSQPFDLAAHPPQRFTLIRTGPAIHRFVWQFHHIQLDGWSTRLVLNQVLAAYQAIRAGGDPAEGAVPGFKDYIAWHQRQDPLAARRYWGAQLSGFREPTALPIGKPRAENAGTAAAAVSSVVPDPVLRRLSQIARQEGVTMATIIHAAWAILLSGRTGRRDVLFGTTVAGRSADLPGIEDVVGMLMNTLPLRMSVDPGQSPAEFFRAMHHRQIALRDREHDSLAQIQRCSEVPAGRRLFDSIVVFENFGDTQPELDGLQIGDAESHSRTGYPLVLAASLGDQLTLRLNYEIDSGDESAASGLLDECIEILSSLAHEPATLSGAAPKKDSQEHGSAGSAARESATSRTSTGPKTGQGAPRDARQQVLARIWSEVLGVDQVGPDDDFFALGGDSILSIQVVAQARKAGIPVTTKQMFACPTVAGLAAVVDGSVAVSVHADQSVVTGDVPLTPIQRWFTKLDWPHDHYNQAAALRADESVDVSTLERALGELTVHHDALRLRLARQDGRWRQWIAGTEPAGLLRVVDLNGITEQDRPTAMENAISDAHASLQLAEGPLLRGVLFRDAGEGDLLVLAVHHVAVDTVSWGVLIEDLNSAYKGQTLPAKTTSFQHWARRLDEYASSDAFAATAAAWQKSVPEVVSLPVDLQGQDNCEGATAIVSARVPASVTETVVHTASSAYRARANDLLATALARTIAEWTGQPSVGFDVEGHGREDLFDDVDLSRTV
ncbi:condensation domain-containing protein, partial [Streptomyces sp. NPDC023998]|uniref:condensation domain-containing protein n=1 Tax=Streptomyces sp. NPDC023998 TaxID=3154597 RepID=UPI0033DB7B84